MDALAAKPLGGRTVVVGHDLLDRSVAGLQSGVVSALITQDPFGQGHDSTIHLFNAIAHGWQPPDARIITRSDVVTPENYTEYWRPYEGSVETSEMHDRRPRPLGPSKKRLRLAVLGIEDGSFWEPVRQGVNAAAQELELCNASVEWLAPGGDYGFNMTTRAQTVEKLTQEGYDGIATPIYDASLIPYLNRAVAAGLVVATLNSEASSLQGLVATLSKERRRLEIAAGTLEAVAHHDALTGAYNRAVMDPDLLEAERVANAVHKQASIIMIDIDHFKAYNDMLGHTAGDEVLRMVAHRIEAEVRPGDRVYRYGGEEFLVLLRATGIDEGQRVAARICDGIASMGLPHDENPPWGVLTVSAGVSALTGDGPTWSEVVAAADAALYRSKASGRNTVATSEPELRGEGRFDSPGDAHHGIRPRSRFR
jgi:diguanylate cyclase (GGDEF)-like protein